MYCIPESMLDEPFYKALRFLDTAEKHSTGHWYRSGKPEITLHIGSKEKANREMLDNPELDPSSPNWKSP